ncbi:hypothetical protein HK405_007083, partial [Cladochytrium tenue]
MFRDSRTIVLRGTSFDLSVAGSFDDTRTILSDGSESSLRVALRCEETGDTWTGNFRSEYVEEITKKTGNFKKFPVFAEMLLSALSQPNDVVNLDLLTASDVESIRSGNEAPRSLQLPAAKVYLILTYASAFDR